MLGNTILHQNDLNGQHTPRTEQLNIPAFITRQIERYTDELAFLQAEVKTVTVLLTAYKSWQSQLKNKGAK